MPAYADGFDLAPFLRGALTDPTRPSTVAFQNHDEDILMVMIAGEACLLSPPNPSFLPPQSWFGVTDGTFKLVQYGTGAEVQPQLFNLSAGQYSGVFDTTQECSNTSDGTRTIQTPLNS